MLAVTVKSPFGKVSPFEDRLDWQVKLLGKVIVPLVARRNRHHTPGPVGSQNIVTDPDWQLFAVHRVNNVGTGKYPGLFLIQVGPFQIRAPGSLFLILSNLFLVFRSGQLVN